MMRILIVKTSSLGDIIQAFSVVQYLKQQIPLCEIDWVVEHSFAEVLQAHPSIDRLFCIQTKKWHNQIFDRKTWREAAQFRRELRGRKYDLVLDLQGNFKSGIVTAIAISSCKVGFAFSSVSEWPNLLSTNKKFNPPEGQNIRDDYLFLAKCS